MSPQNSPPRAKEVQNNQTITSPAPKNSSNVDVILNIQDELYNMGKALSCPLCLSTFRSAVNLPCQHSFCQECIRNALSKSLASSSSSSSSSLRSGSSSSSCPVCKTPCTRRSMVRNQLYDELVKGYKMSLRAFGFAPVVYDAKVNGMTQIEEEVSFSLNSHDYNNDNDNDNDNHDKDDSKNNYFHERNKIKAPVPSLRHVHEHLEVSRAVHTMMKQAEKDMDGVGIDGGKHNNHKNNKNSHTSSSGCSSNSRQQDKDDDSLSSSTTAAYKNSNKVNNAVLERELQNKRKKLSALLKDQEEVVQSDEKTLIRAAVHKHKRTSFGKSRTSLGSHSHSHSHSNNDEDDNDNDNDDDNKTNEEPTNHDETVMGDKHTSKSTALNNSANTTTSSSISSPKPSSILKGGESAITHANPLLEDNMTQSQVYFDIPGANHYDDDDNRPHISPSKQKGGNNSKQIGNNHIMTSQEAYDVSMEELREKEVADRSMEELEDNEDDNVKMQERRTRLISQASEQFYTAQSQNNIKPVNDECDRKEEHIHPIYAIGTIVHVQARTWSGLNKPGGTARIAKVYSNSGAGIKYDVSYVLGGREKLVDESFVKEQKEDNVMFQNENKKVQSPNSTTSSANMRTSRRVGERKMVERWVQEIEESEKEVDSKKNADTTTVRSKVTSNIAGKGKNSQENKLENDNENTLDKKDIESLKHKDKRPTKLKRKSKEKEITLNQKKRRKTTKSPTEEAAQTSSGNLKELNFDEVKSLIEERCQRMLFDTTVNMIYITASSLNDEEQKIIKKMLKLRSSDVKVKLLNDFNPKKTNVCITSSSSENEKISKLRTVKAMRAALAGIPILNMKWVSHCVEQDNLKFPSEGMFVQTLPAKENFFMKPGVNGNDTAHGGVFYLGGHHEHSAKIKAAATLLFDGAYVYLCGNGWKKSSAKVKDVQILLKEGGANILNTANVVAKTMKKGLDDQSNLVLLCDGKIDSNSPSFPKTLSDSVENAINGENGEKYNILVVNSTWLFESISCATLLSAKHFQPDGSLVGALWKSLC